MLTITTRNTGRLISVLKNLKYRRRSVRFTTSTMAWTDTGAWLFIWHAKGFVTVLWPFISIWIKRWGCMRLSVRKSRSICMGSHIRYLIISWPKTSLLSGRIKNGVQILPICSWKMERCVITAVYLIRMTAASLRILRTVISTQNLPSGHYRRHWIRSRCEKENYSFIVIRGHSIHRKHSLSIVNQST